MTTATTTTTAVKPTLDLSNPSPSVVKPATLAHIFLQTTAAQFPAMVRYYKTFLSAAAAHETDHVAFLSYDHEHHRVAIAALPGVVEDDGRARQMPGMRHVAFTYASLVDLASAYGARKVHHGMEPYWCVNHGMTTSMYYRDPDGNGIEAQVCWLSLPPPFFFKNFFFLFGLCLCLIGWFIDD